MGSVIAVSSRTGHHFSKTPNLSIRLLKGLGVAGDAHMGETVKHRSRVRKDPTQPNLRQVHLMHAELFDELRERHHFRHRSVGIANRYAAASWRKRRCRNHRIAQSLHPDRQFPAGPDGRDTGQGCERQSRAQGRHHEHRDIRGRRSARRCDRCRNAGRTVSAVAAGLAGSQLFGAAVIARPCTIRRATCRPEARA